MKEKYQFEPDYHCLNRRAKRTKIKEKYLNPESFFSRFLNGSREEAEVEYDPLLLERVNRKVWAIKKKIDWSQELNSASFVAFDLETTGLRPYRGDEITAFGAVVIEKRKILADPVFYELVNPGRPITLQAQKITGITNEMVRQKPKFMPVLERFLDFCGPRILIAHNAPFDLAFINNKTGQTIGRRIVNPVIDTVLLTSALHYAVGDYSLENLASYFGFNLENRHNALGDAKIAANLFLSLLPSLEEKGVTTLHDLASLFADLDLTRGYPLIF